MDSRIVHRILELIMYLTLAMTSCEVNCQFIIICRCNWSLLLHKTISQHSMTCHIIPPANNAQFKHSYTKQHRTLLTVIINSVQISTRLDLLDLRAMLGFECWQTANKGLPLGSVKDHLGSIDGVAASRIQQNGGHVLLN